MTLEACTVFAKIPVLLIGLVLLMMAGFLRASPVVLCWLPISVFVARHIDAVAPSAVVCGKQLLCSRHS